MPVIENDHGLDCLCDECWPGAPKCGCGGPPDYSLGLGRYSCIYCYDLVNQMVREIVVEAGPCVVVACNLEMEGVDDVRLGTEVHQRGPHHSGRGERQG